MIFVSERFEKKVRVAGPDDCWEWQASRNPDGYGHFAVSSKKWVGAHRVAFEWFHGRLIAPGMEIMHTCDNPPCVNPAHLKEGTHRENMLDSHAKGRSTTVIHTLETLAKQKANTPRGDRSPMKRLEVRLKHLGENNGNNKLTWQQVREIRRLRDEEFWTLKEIAVEFQISHVLAGMIVRGDIWDEAGYERRKQKQTDAPFQPRVLTMPQKGRRAEANGNRRLDWADVRDIRRLREERKLTQDALAAMFGVSQHTIGTILRGQTWKE